MGIRMLFESRWRVCVNQRSVHSETGRHITVLELVSLPSVLGSQFNKALINNVLDYISLIRTISLEKEVAYFN